MIAEAVQELRQAARALARSAGFTTSAVLTLALGVGAAASVFSVVHAVLLRPLPYPEPERLVLLREAGGEATSFATAGDWRERAAGIDALAMVGYWTPTLVEGGSAEQLRGARVSADFFRVMGVAPLLGRGFEAAEDRPGASRVVVLSYGVWERRFGRDPHVVGRTVMLGDTPHSVVGVMPAGFEASLVHVERQPPQIWRPLAYDAADSSACRTCRHLRVIARLRPGVAPAQARRELAAIQQQLVTEHPTDYAAAGIDVLPMKDTLVGTARPALWLLLALVAALLMIAWANLASLVLARIAVRERELAIRRALGAGRGALLRPVLAESALIAIAGGALGLWLADAIGTALLAANPAGLPRAAAGIAPGIVATAAFALSALTMLAVTAVAASRAWRVDAGVALAGGRGSSAAPRHARAQRALVVADVALSLVLLVGAGLLGRSLLALYAVPPGFDPERVLTLELTLSGARYKDDAPGLALYERVLESLRALPGVEAAGMVSVLPLGGNHDSVGMHVPDRPAANPADAPEADRHAISPGYLAALRIPILRGRGFDATDSVSAEPVALVSASFAQQTWAGDALGRHVRVGGPQSSLRTVVGVVGDVRQQGLDAPPTFQVYLPIAQWTPGQVAIVVRAATAAGAVAGSARAVVAAADPTQAVSRMAAMDDVIATSAGTRRFASLLSACFAGLALLLAGVGITGVVGRSVVERTREIGIRLALGARPAAACRLVLGRVLRQALLGAALGSLLALALAPLLRSLLFSVSAHDALTLGAAAVLSLLLPLVAGWIPARHVAHIEPVRALRRE